MMKPVMAELANEYGEKLTIATLDIDQNIQTPSKFSVRGLPTVMRFKNGQVLGQKTGFASKPKLMAADREGVPWRELEAGVT